MTVETVRPLATPAPIAGHSNTVETLQLLRFVAAFMVLIAHVSFFIHNRADDDFRIMGEIAQGVALFFVISGFIMTVTATPKAGEKGAVRYFVLSRLIRIVPLYWAVNAAKLLGLLIVPGMIAANPTIANVVFSLFFLPAKNAVGEVEAFYGVGWSLNFEMAFYAMFALALALKVRPSYLVVPLLVIAVGISFQKQEDWPAAAFLLSPALLNFVWGILIGEWFLTKQKVPTLLSILLIGLGISATYVDIYVFKILKETKVNYGAIVLGFVGLEGMIGSRIPRVFSYLGDSSYSIYLTHPIVGVFSVVALHSLAPSLPAEVLFISTLLICLAFSAASYSFFEKRATSYLRKKFLSARSKLKAVDRRSASESASG